MRRLALLGLALAACGGASAPGEDAANGVSVPEDWVHVQSSCGYRFQAPPEMTALERQGTDSCVDGWSTASCMYSGDYGAFSSNLSEFIDQPQYQALRETIDGRSARLVTALAYGFYVAAVNIAEIDPATPGLGVTVSANCGDVDGQQDALRVFRTLELGEPASAEAGY